MSTDRSGGGNERENNEDEEEQRRRWREIYGDMIPERIVDTRIGEVLKFKNMRKLTLSKVVSLIALLIIDVNY